MTDLVKCPDLWRGGEARASDSCTSSSKEREQLMPALLLVPSARRHSVERGTIWITSVRGGSGQLFVRQGQGAGPTMGGCLVEAELVLLSTLPPAHKTEVQVSSGNTPSLESPPPAAVLGGFPPFLSLNGFYNLRMDILKKWKKKKIFL